LCRSTGCASPASPAAGPAPVHWRAAPGRWRGPQPGRKRPSPHLVGDGERLHHKDVEPKHIIDILLTARVGALYVEGANPRHGHERKVFREVQLPESIVVIPSVIDTKTNIIEHPRSWGRIAS